MIARLWRGSTLASRADEYVSYLHRTGIAAFRSTPGHRGAYLARRLVGDRAEFLIISLWDDMDAVRAFAGPEPERAVFYPEDEHFLITRELTVEHYDVVA